MQKKNYKGRCEKRRLTKSKEVCRFYSNIQSAYGDVLEADREIAEIICNALTEGLEYSQHQQIEQYCVQSDFLLNWHRIYYNI